MLRRVSLCSSVVELFLAGGREDRLAAHRPLGACRPGHGHEVEALRFGLDHAAKPWAPVKADGELAPSLEPSVIDPERRKSVARPLAGIGQVV